MSRLEIIQLKNNNGLELEVLNFGATIISLKVPNKYKKRTNVVVGLEKTNDYISKTYLEKDLYLGSTVGRYAGRISNGSFVINDKEYQLHAKNTIHLHGGKSGFDKKYWHIEHIEKGETPSVTFSCVSKHLEEGYPGNITVRVTYQLTKSNSLKITYKAKTDAATHINLTNHAYFNLNGKSSILDHRLYINSQNYLAVDEKLIPTGSLMATNNTTHNFLQPSNLGTDFKGLDDAFVLNTAQINASLYAKQTGILMNIKTNQPAMVVFTPPTIEGLAFKDSASYDAYPAICFETQKYPDSPNHHHFPSTLLVPKTVYINESSFQFSIE